MNKTLLNDELFQYINKLNKPLMDIQENYQQNINEIRQEIQDTKQKAQAILFQLENQNQESKAKHDAQFTNTVDQILKMHESRRLNAQTTYNLYVPTMKPADSQLQKITEESKQSIKDSQSSGIVVSLDAIDNPASPSQQINSQSQMTPLSKTKAQQDLEVQLSILQNEIFGSNSDRRLTNAQNLQLSSKGSLSISSQQKPQQSQSQRKSSIYETDSDAMQKISSKLQEEVDQYYQQIM